MQIKWPNDIVVDERRRPARRRKLAGILAEASTGADGLQYVILGFGINLRPAAYPPELADRATSIETELGTARRTAARCSPKRSRAGRLFQRLAAGEADPVLARWRALAPSAQGAARNGTRRTGARSGTAAGIADDGALLVNVGGRIERIISGELRWI